jgi:AAA+ superfamily predicted ATPase
MVFYHRLLSDIQFTKKIITGDQYPDEILYLEKELNLSKAEAKALLLMLAYKITANIEDSDSYNDSIEMKDVKKRLNLSAGEYHRLMSTTTALVEKQMLVYENGVSKKTTSLRHTDFFPEYDIHPVVINFVITGEHPKEEVDYSNLYSVLNYFSKLLLQLEDEEITTFKLLMEVKSISQKCTDKIPFNHLLRRLDTEEKTLLLYMNLKWTEGIEEISLVRYLRDIYITLTMSSDMRHSIAEGKIKLIKEGYLQIEENDSFKSDADFSLTKKFRDEFIHTSVKAKEKEFSSKFCTLVKHEEINQKLIFSGELETEITEISKAIGRKKYKELKKRLKENNMPMAFTCLLHGASGTGKTASVYEIAVKTKRNILHVDISAIKDMWVGISEKNLKKIFESYYSAKEHFKYEPILLFNEADSLINKRIEANHSVDHMNNAMQNILLEELEKFDGILFATTNMTMNIDNAFSRRFLYKVYFDVPDASLRAKIWRMKAPHLKAKDTAHLAEFTLSGGEIDNICKRMLVESTIFDKSLGIDDIVKLIKSEMSLKHESTRVGF